MQAVKAGCSVTTHRRRTSGSPAVKGLQDKRIFLKHYQKT